MNKVKEMPKNVKGIVKGFLEENGFDGLYFEAGFLSF